MNKSDKKEIKEIFIKSLEPFAKSVHEEFLKVNKRFDQVDKRFDQVDKRFEQVDKRFEQVDKRFDRIEYRLYNVEKDVKWMKENSSALFTKLDRFIALYEKQEQELLILNSHFKELEERVSKIEARL